MAILNKGLTRPAALFGVPLVPLIIVFMTITLISVYTQFYWALLLLIPALIEMRSKAKKDIHYFSLLLLSLKTRGSRSVNKFFGANTITAGKYGNIDITEFCEKMRLSDCVDISKYVPYSTHIDQHIVKNKKGDLISTWELGGTIFECEDSFHLNLMSTQLNNLIRSYEGMPFTFYIHRIRESFTDGFECNSGIPFSDELARLYYKSIVDRPFRRCRLYFTACFIPLSKLEKAALKSKSIGDRETALNEALKMMREHWSNGKKSRT